MAGGTRARGRRSLGFRTLGWCGAVLVVGFVVLPLWYMLVSSLDADPVGDRVRLWPVTWTGENYRFLFSPSVAFFPALARSVALSLGTTVAALALAVPAAYALGRLRVRGAGRILAAMLALVFFPGALLVVPIKKVLSDLGWVDQLWSIGVAQLSFTLPLAVWFLTYAFREIPDEVEEAARVDGAGLAVRLFAIVLPMARSGVAATAALVFVFSWNDFLFSTSLSLRPRSETLSVTLSRLPELGFLGVQMAAGVVVTIPVIVVVALLQRWVVDRVAVRTR